MTDTPDTGPATYLLSGDPAETRDLSRRASTRALRSHTVTTAQDLPPLPAGAIVYASSLSAEVTAALHLNLHLGDLLSSFFLPLDWPAEPGAGTPGASVNVTGDARHAEHLRQAAEQSGFRHDVRCVQSARELGTLPAAAVVLAQFITPDIASLLQRALKRGEIAQLYLL